MKQTKLSVAIKATLLGASIVLAPASFAADKELLDILKANGSLSQAQYDQLIQKADQPSESSELLKKMAWAGKIKVSGDLRLRQENNKGSSTKDGNKDRQRIRARIGVYADIADNVQAGVRFATGSSSSATSTNQTLENDFEEKELWIDLAYINWQPIDGLELIGGKFKQPWHNFKTGLIWDGDINPEGAALRYTTHLAGTDLVVSAGHLVRSEDSNDTVSEDAKVTFGQLAAHFKIANANTILGFSVFDFDARNGESTMAASYQDSEQFKLTEVFAETNIELGLPVKLYGQYVINNDADGVNDGEDTAWLLGAGTKLGKWKMSYDYRETELNAVNGLFNDSDFAGGNTGSEGSRWKLAYEISKNFSVGTTYLDSEVKRLNAASKGDQDTWQIDLVAKF
ncbi:MAG: putative porin [Cycloclasticus sp.]|nr:putative porin [Cycloclasticus sp.]